MREFCVAAVFSSNMVLQRDKNVRIFGEGEDGARVTVTLSSDGEVLARADGVCRDGKWLVTLPPMEARENVTVVVTSGAFEKVMTNVAIGEVWLCGGQSNMEFELQNITGGREYLTKDVNPGVRFYYTQKKGYLDEDFYATEKLMCWKEFNEQDAACWSGVGYLFAKELAAKLGVTVGLIGCNWGGTSASAWTSKDSLLSDRDVSVYWTDFEEKNRGVSMEEQIAAYLAYEKFHEEWTQKQVALYQENPSIGWDEVQEILGPCQWPGPMNGRNPFRPAGLYETMVLRVAPYTMRGVLFYQGESDDHRPKLYRRLFTIMMEEWRRVFMEKELPFLFVQLPMHRYAADPDYKHWCLVREAQMDCFDALKHTGICVAIDCGEFNEIHPKDKVPVAHRLFLQACSEVYGVMSEDECFGPMFADAVMRGKELECRFAHAKDGFVIRGEEAVGFEVAGEACEFYPAKARMEGSSIYLFAPEVEKPVYARYLWTNYGEVTLYGANGIPVAPFRSSREDERTEVQAQVAIQQIMEL